MCCECDGNSLLVCSALRRICALPFYSPCPKVVLANFNGPRDLVFFFVNVDEAIFVFSQVKALFHLFLSGCHSRKNVQSFASWQMSGWKDQRDTQKRGNAASCQ